jgi:hypothetical protein
MISPRDIKIRDLNRAWVKRWKIAKDSNPELMAKPMNPK